MLVITFVAHLLAALVGIGSVCFYGSAFFYPEVNRPRDYVWSGLGLVYAALLWIGAAQMTAAILLGQAVAAVLLFVLGWQTLSIRRAKTPVYQQTPVVITPEVAGNWAKNKINDLRIAPAEPVPLKLEKRSFDEFSKGTLGDRSDPRRRPRYEYEFVDDGVWDEVSETVDEQHEEMLPIEEVPSAIANVISVEVPAPVKGEETADDEFVEDESVEDESLETAQARESIVSSEVTEEVDSFGEPENVGLDEVEEVGSFEELEEVALEPSLETLGEDSRIAEEEGVERIENTLTREDALAWDDDSWMDEPLMEGPQSSDARAERPKVGEVEVKNVGAIAKEKPSLIAVPIILIGWVKDVFTSLAKPKPSKPVIEIPRREPSPSQPQKVSVEDAISTEFGGNDEIEESNWDD